MTNTLLKIIIYISCILLGLTACMADGETWEASSKYVLAELDEIKCDVRDLILDSRVQHDSVIAKMDSLRESINDHAIKNASDISALRAKAAGYGAIAGAGPAGLLILFLGIQNKRKNGKNGKNGNGN